MGLNPKFSTPRGDAPQFERPKHDDVAPEVAVSPHPVIVAFAFYKAGNEYVAEAIKVQGDKVVARKELGKDDFKRIALDAADKATFAYWNHAEDPFMAKKRED